MSVELKIKSKHLALEPAIIRKEEHKLKKHIKHLKSYHQINDDYSSTIYPFHTKLCSLTNHRKTIVRNEARATYLARAYLKGLTYDQVENNTDKWFVKDHIIPRVLDMVAKYGPHKIYKYHTANGKREYRHEEYTTLLTKLYKWVNIE